jgi:hypothetical protein
LLWVPLSAKVAADVVVVVVDDDDDDDDDVKHVRVAVTGGTGSKSCICRREGGQTLLSVFDDWWNGRLRGGASLLFSFAEVQH